MSVNTFSAFERTELPFIGYSNSSDIIALGTTTITLLEPLGLKFPASGNLVPGQLYRVRMTGTALSSSTSGALSASATQYQEGVLQQFDNVGGTMTIIVDTVNTGTLKNGGTGSAWTVTPTSASVIGSPTYFVGTPFPWSGDGFGGTVVDEWEAGQTKDSAAYPTYSLNPTDTNTVGQWPPFPYSSSTMPPSYHT